MQGFLTVSRTVRKSGPFIGLALGALALASWAPVPARAQEPPQLDRLVQRIALYPDPLLAQVMTASTYWNDIPDAAGWANEHSYLKGDHLTRAISEDNLPWDPGVLALLPFPSVLDMMSHDMAWTEDLGNAVLRNRDAVMDAVQRMRQRAMDEGYLRTNGEFRVVVGGPGDIEVLPVSPGYLCVPTYNPMLVFGGRRAAVSIGAVGCGPSVAIGGMYGVWGLGRFGFAWRNHGIIVDRQPWGRNWENRGFYAHHFSPQMPRFHGPRVERHGEHAERRDHDEHDHDHGH